MKIVERNFIAYKLLNSLFTGLSIGILFTIYEPLKPIVYSVGGMVLAVAMLVIALFYDKLLNIRSFFRISLVVEFVMLFTLVAFLLMGVGLYSALLIYSGYQLTFIFGGYLVRAETLVAKEKDLLMKIDMSKQVGYLVGMGLSSLYYLAVEYFLDMTEALDQITLLHYFLIALQSIIILAVITSFKKTSSIVQG